LISEQLSANAQSWAETCARNRFTGHDDSRGYGIGECVSGASFPQPADNNDIIQLDEVQAEKAVIEAVEKFYSENVNYDYNVPKWDTKTGNLFNRLRTISN
jgi:hypothetical protein